MENKSNGRIGFCGFLTIVFKLCKVISWSWIWVFSPIWIPLALAITFVVVAMIISSIRKS